LAGGAELLLEDDIIYENEVSKDSEVASKVTGSPYKVTGKREGEKQRSLTESRQLLIPW
jgi:hypothetical protein